MNKNISRRHNRRGLLWKRSRGQSIAEFGYLLPILAMMLVASADFARVFFLSIAVNNAARAGAQYGSQSVINAASAPASAGRPTWSAASKSSAMAAAAVADGSNVPGLTASASQCTCVASSSVTQCDSTHDCSDYKNTTTGVSSVTFVEVDTAATFTPLLNLSFLGLPSSFTLNGRAVMQVQE
jgi:Flp pilus assembly protein TadG